MTAMAKQVEDFLNTSAPFDVLDKEQKLELVKHTELIYVTLSMCLIKNRNWS